MEILSADAECFEADVDNVPTLHPGDGDEVVLVLLFVLTAGGDGVDGGAKGLELGLGHESIVVRAEGSVVGRRGFGREVVVLASGRCVGGAGRCRARARASVRTTNASQELELVPTGSHDERGWAFMGVTAEC
jgi:hypothetical protein